MCLCVVMCCGWAVRVVVVVSCCAVCVRVSFLLALGNAPVSTFKNALVCIFKTLPCVPLKRPFHMRHGRFDGTHGSVLKVPHECVSGRLSVCPSLPSYVCPSLRSLCSSLSRSLVSVSVSLSLSCRLSLSVLTDDDNEYSSSWLSLYTRL